MIPAKLMLDQERGQRAAEAAQVINQQGLPQAARPPAPCGGEVRRVRHVQLYASASSQVLVETMGQLR